MTEEELNELYRDAIHQEARLTPHEREQGLGRYPRHVINLLGVLGRVMAERDDREEDSIHWMKEHNEVLDKWGGWLDTAQTAAQEVYALLAEEWRHSSDGQAILDELEAKYRLLKR